MPKGRGIISEALANLETTLGSAGRGARLTEKNIVKTGTTSLAIRCPDGVILAADRQVSIGSTIFSRNYRKITPISPHSAITYAGAVALIQMICESLHGPISRFTKRNDRILPLESQAQILKILLRQLVFVHRINIGSMFILAGYNPSDGPKIYSFDAWGGTYEKSENYEVVGSGSSYALGALRVLECLGKEKRLSMADAIMAIQTSGYFDSLTSDPASTLPMVLTIDKDGITEIALKTSPEKEPGGATTAPEAVVVS